LELFQGQFELALPAQEVLFAGLLLLLEEAAFVLEKGAVLVVVGF
jgi:hypothetical protein